MLAKKGRTEKERQANLASWNQQLQQMSGRLLVFVVDCGNRFGSSADKDSEILGAESVKR